MGCRWCKSHFRPLPANECISDLLLNDQSEKRESQSPSSVVSTNHVSECEQCDDSDALPPPELIPDIRSLQSLLFRVVHEQYGEYLYPKAPGLFGELWQYRSQTLEKQQIERDILSVSLSIASFANGANVAYRSNMHNLLKYSIQSNFGFTLLPELIGLILSFLSAVTFSDDIELKEHRDQLQFSSDRNTVAFKYMVDDYLNIRSEHILVGRVDINCYVHGKGDEMWIGLVHRGTYQITGEIERKHGSLLYYGGRESRINRNDRPQYNEWDSGMGAIHGFTKVLKETDYYQSGIMDIVCWDSLQPILVLCG